MWKRRHLVAEAEVADHLVEHVARAGSDAAVVEIDPGPVDVEGPLDLRPVIFLACQLVGRGLGRILAGPGGACDRVAAEHRRRPTPPERPAMKSRRLFILGSSQFE